MLLTFIRKLVKGCGEEEADGNLLSYAVWREVYNRLEWNSSGLTKIFSSVHTPNWIIPVLGSRELDLKVLECFQHAFKQLGVSFDFGMIVVGGQLLALKHDREPKVPYYVEIYPRENVEMKISGDDCVKRGIQATTLVEELFFNLAFYLAKNRFPGASLAITMCGGTWIGPLTIDGRPQVIALHPEGKSLYVRKYRSSLAGPQFGIRRTVPVPVEQ